MSRHEPARAIGPRHLYYGRCWGPSAVNGVGRLDSLDRFPLW
jgi:hypothetical protein